MRPAILVFKHKIKTKKLLYYLYNFQAPHLSEFLNSLQSFPVLIKTFMLWLLSSSPTSFLAGHSYLPKVSELFHAWISPLKFEEAVPFYWKVLPTLSHLANSTSSFRTRIESFPSRGIISYEVDAPTSVFSESTKTFLTMWFLSTFMLPLKPV